MKKRIAIIGAGNMGKAIAQGLLRGKLTTRDRIILTNSKTKNNKEAARKAAIIILAVKPQVTTIVLEEIKDVVKDQLVISVMAGISIGLILKILGEKTAVVRVMPNLAAKVGKSMSVWTKNKGVTKIQEKVTRLILGLIGEQLEVWQEDQIDKATAISGSGPAYVFYIAELLAKNAEKMGIERAFAQKISRQTIIGAAKLLENSSQPAEVLRANVPSKGGTTEAAFKEFKKDKFAEIFSSGILKATLRAQQIRESLTVSH